ncbi:MAG: RtcB family protein [Fervidobacterium pennivorans]|jgi:tRNA-splicing ligase RtcB|uniref:tRNA-splicing ligase RtcB n=1 Tax=Fervidobacterium pennivorans TaxID=93466 RepID=A0A172T347_FERPE|nr:RtcB family protein [Fervidobacterium pennivorans]ANE41273.1 tRNA-splicing ligase [Fervidobacterium pennivorans]MDM7321232.1 RtcB family protein [Fervidobacterium sp.]QIV77933.1 RtcB family protein [Fervidobacterium pennivorans subsp. keratinolyticus]
MSIPGVEKEGKYIYRIKKTGNMRVDAIVLADYETIDEEAIEQLKNVATLPGIVKAAYAMPDIHWGYGFPIGGVAAFDLEDGIISPGGVGFDINCGVRMLVVDGNSDIVKKNLESLIKRIYESVPVGVGETSDLRFSKNDFKKIVEQGVRKVIEMGYGTEEDLLRIEDRGTLEDCDFSDVSEEAYERGKDELGTLGAGNHFIEIQLVEEVYDEEIASVFGIKKGDITILIHTGSRGFGHQIATDYIKYMRDNLKDHNKNLPDKQLINAPFKSEWGQAYYSAMNCAANYAFANRQIITHMIRKAFKSVVGMNVRLVYDVAHNIAKVEEYEIDGRKRKVIVHRKGATRAFGPGNPALPEVFKKTGQPVIIPGSMGTASYILVGTKKAEEITFGSTAHGAGRALGRREATRELSVNHVLKELESKGIKIMAKSKKGIVEEAPEAYKNVDKVVQIVDEIGISLKIAKCTPLGVVKG